MKHIFEHSQTQYLLDWAGDLPLITAEFLFWNSGAVQQVTQSGLLPKLLHDILEQHKDLIQLVKPEH